MLQWKPSATLVEFVVGKGRAEPRGLDIIAVFGSTDRTPAVVDFVEKYEAHFMRRATEDKWSSNLEAFEVSENLMSQHGGRGEGIHSIVWGAIDDKPEDVARKQMAASSSVAESSASSNTKYAIKIAQGSHPGGVGGLGMGKGGRRVHYRRKKTQSKEPMELHKEMKLQLTCLQHMHAFILDRLWPDGWHDGETASSSSSSASSAAPSFSLSETYNKKKNHLSAPFILIDDEGSSSTFTGSKAVALPAVSFEGWVGRVVLIRTSELTAALAKGSPPKRNAAAAAAATAAAAAAAAAAATAATAAASASASASSFSGVAAGTVGTMGVTGTVGTLGTVGSTKTSKKAKKIKVEKPAPAPLAHRPPSVIASISYLVQNLFVSLVDRSKMELDAEGIAAIASLQRGGGGGGEAVNGSGRAGSSGGGGMHSKLKLFVVHRAVMVGGELDMPSWLNMKHLVSDDEGRKVMCHQCHSKRNGFKRCRTSQLHQTPAWDEGDETLAKNLHLLDAPNPVTWHVQSSALAATVAGVAGGSLGGNVQRAGKLAGLSGGGTIGHLGSGGDPQLFSALQAGRPLGRTLAYGKKGGGEDVGVWHEGSHRV